MDRDPARAACGITLLFWTAAGFGPRVEPNRTLLGLFAFAVTLAALVVQGMVVREEWGMLTRPPKRTVKVKKKPTKRRKK